MIHGFVTKRFIDFDRAQSFIVDKAEAVLRHTCVELAPTQHKLYTLP